jgi:hypothetical protein
MPCITRWACSERDRIRLIDALDGFLNTRVNERTLELNNIDCLEGMKLIANGSVDMILCDLPYGTTQNKWDSVTRLEPLWSQYRRIIKPNGAIVLTAQFRSAPR